MINLYINERRVEDVTILDLKGRERIRGAVIALHESIRCLAREGKIQVLLDLAWVKHIDSGGLGELVLTKTHHCDPKAEAPVAIGEALKDHLGRQV